VECVPIERQPSKAFDRLKTIASVVFTQRLWRSREQVMNDLNFGILPRESHPKNLFRRMLDGHDLGQEVVLEKDLMTVIKDKYTAAETHLLVLPKEPLFSVVSFQYTTNDVELLEAMIETGKEAMRLEAPHDNISD